MVKELWVVYNSELDKYLCYTPSGYGYLIWGEYMEDMVYNCLYGKDIDDIIKKFKNWGFSIFPDKESDHSEKFNLYDESHWFVRITGEELDQGITNNLHKWEPDHSECINVMEY